MHVLRRMKLTKVLCSAAIGLLAMSAASAEPSFKIGGFGTVGGAVTGNEDTQFRNGLDQWSGTDKHLDLFQDTKLGLQGTINFTSDFSVTSQLLGKRREDQDMDINFEWLYAQYTGISGFDFKLGRVVLPAFLVSDARFVGYSSPWVRVPTLVYSMLPFSTVDGGQVSYRTSIGPAIASFQFTHGHSASNIFVTSAVPIPFVGTIYVPAVIETNSPKVNGINASIEWGDWTLRVGEVRSNVKFNLRDVGPLPSFTDTFKEAGIQYDNGQFVVMSEYVKRTTKPELYDSNGWYLGTGYHFGSVMPYVIASQFKLKTDNPNGKASKGLAVGARYDFAKNLALKGEFARYDTNDTLIFTDNVRPAAYDKKVNMLSVTLDFVF